VNPTSIRSWPRRSFQLDVKCLCNQAKHKNSHVAFLLLSFGDTSVGGLLVFDAVGCAMRLSKNVGEQF
jgi:hypothetical protein